jgi:serine phosphatase RsbU (regulator of sigma subunit)
VVGAASLAVAIIIGVAGPLGPSALFARLVIIALGIAMGAIGAVVRERQAGTIVELGETKALLQAFERGLAPAPHPPAGFLAVARYRPAEDRMQLGGDFLEAVGLPDGRLAVLIGDVCGHGPREAAVGSALRAGWKSIALGDKHDPTEWVEALHQAFFLDGRIDTFVTLCTGYLDRTARTARFVTAGHPPPLLLRPPVRPLDVPPAPALGIGRTDAWFTTETPWRGDPLLLYTDGLVENPRLSGPPQRWGEPGLMRWLDANASLPPAAVPDALMSAATAGRDLRDDVAVLLLAGDG